MQNDTIKKEFLSIGEASEYLGISIDTLRRWEKRKRINAYRSPGGHRYFIKSELDNLFGLKYTRDEDMLFEGSTTKISPNEDEEKVEHPLEIQEKSPLPTPPIDTPPTPPPTIQTSYNYFTVPELQVTKITTTTQTETETITVRDETSPEPLSSPITLTETKPVQNEALLTSKIEMSKPHEVQIQEKVENTPILQNDLSHQVPISDAVVPSSPRSVSFQDILSDSKKKDSNPAYIKYIVAGIIIFTVIDIVFALMWFNSK